jgi:hypothetical protein
MHGVHLVNGCIVAFEGIQRSFRFSAAGALTASTIGGKTGPSLFYRKLWQVCMDMIRTRQNDAKLFSRERT